MYQWTDINSALNSLDPISGMSHDQLNRIDLYTAAQKPRSAGKAHGLRQRTAAGLLRLAVMLDGRAQLALTEARGQR
ncbi:MAG TPA: hypothetical protein VH951_03715 [Dehalococcoidia bacterium]|jgi:hypothetical protein